MYVWFDVFISALTHLLDELCRKMRSCMTNMECLSFPVTMDIVLSLTESKRSGWQTP